MALSVSPALRRQVRLGLVALSLGNLMFLRRWYDLEHVQSKALDYYRAGPASGVLLASTCLASLIAAAAFRLAWMWVESSPHRLRSLVGHCSFLTVLIFPPELMRRYWNSTGDGFDWFTNISILALEILLLRGIVQRLLGSPKSVMAAKASVISVSLLLPALALDFGNSYLGQEPAGAYQPKTPLPMLPVRAGAPRVLWLLFDEFDPRPAFERRPASLDLPELDRLRAESLVATSALPTDTFTIVAAPSLLSGRLLSRTEMKDAATVLLTPQRSAHATDWRSVPTVFHKVRELGINTELVGWYHPYCRVLGDEVVRCLSLSTGDATPALALQTHAYRQGVVRSAGFLFRLLAQSIRGIFAGDSTAGWLAMQDQIVQQRQQQEYFEIRDRALAAARDARIGMAFVHYPAPHMLPIYNRRARSFDLNGTLDYADNLALVDRTVGELRQALEQAGLWDSTTLLISSDHGLRPELWRNRLGWTPELERLTEGRPSSAVPFVLKLAGEHKGTVLSTPFSTVLTSGLVLAVLRQEVGNGEQAAEWLLRNRDQEPARQVGASTGN